MMASKFILTACASVLIIVFGMPNIEQSRQEARNQQAFILAEQIKAGKLPADTPDPWGNSFEIQSTPAGTTIVTSCGINGTTPADGHDSDDVSTSMSDPPARRTGRRKRIRLFATLAVAATPWIVLFAFFARSGHSFRSHPSGIPHAEEQAHTAEYD